MRSFPNTQGDMSNGESEAEVVEDEPEEVEVIDMSLEDLPVSPEEAGANARSPSPTPNSAALDLPELICRDEVYETRAEATMLLDAAREEERAARGSPRFVAPRSRSPSPAALAASYVQVRGASHLSPATLRNLERERRSREEATRRANRIRLLIDQGSMDQGSAEDSDRSRSSQRRKEQEDPDEVEKKRCRPASTWTPPRRRSLSPRIRCVSPHNCLDPDTGGCSHKVLDPNRRSRSVTPESRENQTASR